MLLEGIIPIWGTNLPDVLRLTQVPGCAYECAHFRPRGDHGPEVRDHPKRRAAVQDLPVLDQGNG